MANILSLAMKISADASGVVKNLTPAERALEKLGAEAAKVTDVFDKFASGSQAAAAAQRQAATDFAFLNSALKTGQVTAAQYAEEYAKLEASSKATADAFARGLEVTRQYVSAEQQRADTVSELDRLLKLGAISQETYNRAVFQGSEAQAKAIEADKQRLEAERQRLQVFSEGQRLSEQFATTEERRANQLAEVARLLREGAISEETAARARAEFSGANEAAARAEQQRLEAERQRLQTAAENERAVATTRAESERQQLRTAEENARAIAKARAEADRQSAESVRLRLKEYEESEKRRKEAAEDAERFIAELNRQTQQEIAAEMAANEAKRAQAIAAAARIIQANLTPQENYDQQMQELNEHLREGRLSQEQFNRAAAKAEQDLSGVAKEATKADDNIDRLNKNVSILAKIEIGRLVIDGLQALSSVFTRVTSQVTSLVTSVNAGVDALGDLSARTGIQVEALQGYSLAAKLAGVDTEQFGSAVQSLAVNIGKANPGDALDKSLRGINLSVAELRALSPEQQFSAIGAAISQLPTAADRAAAAVEIFGKQGAALAPLFREGAASIEELQARAERLGIIISETQVNNVADMNDAFNLVSATVQGITGQVIGNLAPAVTAVVDEFLKFVEEFNGTTGEGGTGIANAITDVLLKGAEYFAAVFDEFLSRFDGLGVTLQDTSATFVSSANAFTFVSEGLRTVANVFELAGNALSAALGKIIETLGSFVSDDLEQYGKELTRQAMIATEKNSRDLEDAAANAGKAFVGIFTGEGGSAAAAGQGAAQKYLAGLSAEIAQARLPEVKVQTNLGKTEEDLKRFLATATGETSKFLNESVATLDTFEKMAQEGNLTAAQIEIMNGFMKNVNAELTKEKQLRQEAADAATAQAEADKKRLDQLLQTNDEAAKIEADLQTVQREQARVSEELAAARAADNQTQADAAAARQGELDQLQAKLEDQQQALEQGFGQGFDAAFNAVNQNIDGLIAKSQQFGQAGFDAALRLQEGIAAAQQQAQDGILNQEAFNQEVLRQQALFDNELAHLQKVKDERKKDADQAVADQKQRNAELLKSQDDYRKQEEAALQAYQQQQQQAQQAYAQEQARQQEEQRKAAEAEAKRQEDRLRKLNTLGQTSVQTADIRTQEGAALVLGIANAAQDPAAIQARLQTKLLEKIALGIGQAASNYFNTPVAIVGYSQVGGIN
jgi:hypothetical protein